MTVQTEELAANPTDAEWPLVEAVVARDRGAAEAFCRRYEPVLRRYFESRWRGSPLHGQLQDAAHEAVFECLRPGGALTRLDRQRCPGLEAFLRGVARNVAARVERREARHSARWRGDATKIAGLVDGEGDLPEHLGRASLGSAVRDAVAALDDEPAAADHSLGELVRLHFREGLAVREIAARWGLPADTVHELRRCACQKLRRRLARIGADYVRRPMETSAPDRDGLPTAARGA
ncbi:MAG: sigma-70 family RNA polymerase sigma factor [Planctomycetes bacterium]|nr:sigma-70 family RNA polymerase sigma factor [Planctomycetota bacterium]